MGKLVGLGYLPSVSYIDKFNPNPRKKYLPWGKTWPKCHFLRRISWVGLALGWGVRRFHDNIYLFSNPTLLVENRKHPSYTTFPATVIVNGIVSGIGQIQSDVQIA